MQFWVDCPAVFLNRMDEYSLTQQMLPLLGPPLTEVSKAAAFSALLSAQTWWYAYGELIVESLADIPSTHLFGEQIETRQEKIQISQLTLLEKTKARDVYHGHVGP